jgi:hypothetical protein
MAPDLDPRLEDTTRQAFARLFDSIEVAVPDQPPAPEPAGRPPRRERHRRRPRTVVLAGAGLAAAAAIAVAVLVVPDRSSPDRVSTEGPSTTTTTTAPTTTPSSTSTTAPRDTTTTTGESPSSTTTSTTSSPPPTEPGLRPAEILPALDPTGLTDVVTDQAVNGPVTLQAGAGGRQVAMQLSAPWLTGFGPGIEGTARELQAYWMVSTVDNQHVVWGLASDEIRQVDVYLTDGQVVSTDTVAFPPGAGTRAFAVVLPQLAEIEGLAGARADGSVFLAGSRVEESLAQVSQPGPHLREWTAFVPMVVH